MTIIIYCREHAPKMVIGVNGDLPFEHDVDPGTGVVTHMDVGKLEVSDDPILDGETTLQYMSRLGTTYEAQMT